MVFRIFDKVPHDQKVVYISHVLDGVKLICQSVFQLLGRLAVAVTQSFVTKVLQILPCSEPLRHIILWKLCHTELDLYRATVRDPLCIVQRLERIREKLLHLLRGFHIVLSPRIAHPVLIGKLFPRLDAQQDIMRSGIFRVSIVDIIGSHQSDPCFLRHFKQMLVHQPLFRYAMILEFEEIIVLSENVLIFQRSLFSLIVKPLCDIPLYLSGQTCAQGNDPLMVFSQKLFIYTRLIIVSLNKAF